MEPETSENNIQENTLPDVDTDWSYLKVLLVDDNEINLKLAKTLLTGRNIDVDTAENGELAVQCANTKHYDIIFMDLHMPKADGFQATEIIRSSDNPCKNTVIIALTANAMPEEQMRVFETGMNDILIKPINEEQIFSLFKRWLEADVKDTEKQNSNQLENQSTLAIYDNDEAIKLAGGNTQLADELFSMLVKELPDHAKRIKQTKEKDDSEKLKQHVHKLHGATSYCGVPKLRKAAKQLEDIIDHQDTMKLDKACVDVMNTINEVIAFYNQRIDNN